MSQGGSGSIPTLVVDDEQLAREELSFLLKDFPEIELLSTAANGLEAVSLIETVRTRAGVSRRSDARARWA